jgi:hypothetical protein
MQTQPVYGPGRPGEDALRLAGSGAGEVAPAEFVEQFSQAVRNSVFRPYGLLQTFADRVANRP